MVRRCGLCMILALAWVSVVSTSAQYSLNLGDSAAQELKRAKAQWPAFFTAFRAAVRKRDYSALKSMMASDFQYKIYPVDVGSSGDTREVAIRYLSKESTHWWILQDSLKRPLYKVEKKRRTASSGECYTDFEFRDRWYFISFSCSEE